MEQLSGKLKEAKKIEDEARRKWEASFEKLQSLQKQVGVTVPILEFALK